MKALIVATLLATAASAGLTAREAPLAHQLEGYTFAQYVADFNKHYASDAEYAAHKATFEAELKHIKAHNAKPGVSFKKGINHMSDQTHEQFMKLNGDIVHDETHASRPVFKSSGDFTVPATLDYRRAFPAVLTAVKDQGRCGSCWAFSAAEAVESAYAFKTGKLFVLSKQQMVSCAENPRKCGGEGGCKGATAGIGIDYASQGVGIGQEWVTSYQSYFGVVPKCDFDPAKNSVLIKANGYVVNTRNDQNAVLESLVKNGPQGVSIDASNWKSYESGIFTDCDYNKNISINHAVQLVGYGTDHALKMDYWIVRNSWSAKWGENGFMRLARTATPQCGWSNDWPTAGSGCPDSDPKDVWVCGTCGILYNSLYAKMD